ncbi:hypothetical protein MRB53_019528 [Persea americana]|uniref:Uncharacterized protein n=1 Tax=Persea americana TaxID=3435 RepID=A0ACC2KYI5_PERAE|nr:hypothetical protein MRB53_019528 [Persea americana]
MWKNWKRLHFYLNDRFDFLDETCSSGESGPGPGRKFQIKSIYGVNGERKLDWPEHSLDTPPQLLPSSSKLRRVWSSSARIGFSWMKKPLILASQDFEMNDGLRRVYRSSGNLVSVYAEQQQDEREVIDSLPDISA